jgi:hypothetical protein
MYMQTRERLPGRDTRATDQGQSGPALGPEMAD